METAINIFIVTLTLTAFLYIAVIFFITVGWLHLKEFQASAKTPSVTISVIIAARNESDNIPALLQSLSQQNYPSKFTEIIFIDDHSEDDTYNLLNGYALKNRNVLCLQSTGVGKKQAVAQGVAHSTGEMIVTTDADCIVPPGWLNNLADYYQSKEILLIIAPVVYQKERNFLQKFFSLDFISLVASGAGSASLHLPLMGNAANMAYCRELRDEILQNTQGTGFASGDDVFAIHYVAEKYGSRAIGFLKSRQCIVRTRTPENLHDFFQQRLRWGSKAKAYRSLWPNFVSLLIFAFNFMLTLLLPLALVFNWTLILYGLFVLLKFLADYPLIKSFAIFSKKQNITHLLFLFECVYPLYISFIALKALFAKYEWKGRKNLK